MEMDDESVAALLDDIDEGNAEDFISDWVFNEKIPVTQDFVASRLKVPLEDARKHMERFYQCTKGKKSVYAVYYLSGVVDIKSAEVYKSGLVREKNLDKAKNRFKRISSCHVFSLQCADVKDMATVLLADGSGRQYDQDNRLCPITCQNGVRRATVESTPEKPKQPPVPVQDISLKPKTTKEDKGTKVEGAKIKGSTKPTDKKRPTAASGASPKKQARLTSFFTKP